MVGPKVWRYCGKTYPFEFPGIIEKPISVFAGKWVLGLGLLVTSLMTLLTPVAANVGVELLIAVRVIEGVAEVWRTHFLISLGSYVYMKMK